MLCTYDEGLEYVIMESLPAVSRASQATNAPDFCQMVEAESYVDDVSCQPV